LLTDHGEKKQGLVIRVGKGGPNRYLGRLFGKLKKREIRARGGILTGKLNLGQKDEGGVGLGNFQTRRENFQGSAGEGGVVGNIAEKSSPELVSMDKEEQNGDLIYVF